MNLKKISPEKNKLISDIDLINLNNILTQKK